MFIFQGLILKKRGENMKYLEGVDTSHPTIEKLFFEQIKRLSVGC